MRAVIEYLKLAAFVAAFVLFVGGCFYLDKLRFVQCVN